MSFFLFKKNLCSVQSASGCIYESKVLIDGLVLLGGGTFCHLWREEYNVRMDEPVKWALEDEAHLVLWYIMLGLCSALIRHLGGD